MFLSRNLTSAETRYSTTEIELLSLIYTIKKARLYLTKPFRVFTDHIPLKLILNIKTSVSSRITRWAAFLSAWTFTVEYLPGAKNKVADYLRRLPNYERAFDSKAKPQLIDLEKEFEELKKIIQRGKPIELYSNQAPILVVNAEVPFEPIIDRAQILEEQNKDENIKSIVSSLRENSENDPEYFFDTDGLLYKHRVKIWDRDRLVVPKVYRRRILDLYHDNPISGGHRGGVTRTYCRVNQGFYWPGMYKDIEQYCKACPICNQFKPDLRKKKAPLKHMFLPQCPGHMAAIDICGPFRTTPNFNKYVLSEF